jgi:hypothetical protein
MEPRFLNERCDVFMNKSEIRMERRIESGRFKKIPSFQPKNDDIMQLIMKNLHEQRLNRRPMDFFKKLEAFFVSMMNHQLVLKCCKSCIILYLTVNQ